MPFKSDVIFLSGSFFIAFWNLSFNYNHLVHINLIFFKNSCNTILLIDFKYIFSDYFLKSCGSPFIIIAWDTVKSNSVFLIMQKLLMQNEDIYKIELHSFSNTCAITWHDILFSITKTILGIYIWSETWPTSSHLISWNTIGNNIVMGLSATEIFPQNSRTVLLPKGTVGE